METTHEGIILIVEDDRNSLSLLFDSLEVLRQKIFVAENGGDALRLAKKYTPDIILLDVMLPDADGFEVCTRLKSMPETKRIPVIFMTAMTQTVDKVKGFQAGGVDYITKPFDVDELLVRVKTQLHIKRLQETVIQERDRFHRLVEASSEGVFLLKGNTIHEANPAAEKMTGYALSELTGMDCRRLFSPAHQKMVGGLFRKKTTLHVIHEVTGQRKDGTSSQLRLQVKQLPHMKETPHILLLQDMTYERELEEENKGLKQSLDNPGYFGDMVGVSSAMKMVFKQITLSAKSDETVVISGETGTGKELAARMIHKLATHYTRSFVVVNCASINDTLFESHFFGYRKGAFTGAIENRPGFLDQANGGTLFLDEVGELPPVMQAKLLRVFQEGEYMPVGGPETCHTDVRIVAATNKNIEEMVKTGLMREDFYHRLNVIHVSIPPLRDRIEDIPFLVKHFFSLQPDRVPPQKNISDKQIRALCAHDWPGNVRELFNVLRRFRVEGKLHIDTPMINDNQINLQQKIPFLEEKLPLGKAVEAFEKYYIERTLEQCRGKKQLAADELGINRKTLYNKLN